MACLNISAAVLGANVAPIAIPSVNDLAESSQKNETKPEGSATGATVKKKVADESTGAIGENTDPGSHPVSDQAEDRSKRVKLNDKTEYPVLTEIVKKMSVTDSEVLSNYNTHSRF
ncbi:hypothetical protein V1508DRAFT_397824 [Lipomyces doorenjongii]|uniref:uncharacterized protein n=1 Tax=Lipomyces doorenjongii TaxID=383834 RepID=UPI0034CD6333